MLEPKSRVDMEQASNGWQGVERGSGNRGEGGVLNKLKHETHTRCCWDVPSFLLRL